MNVIGVAIEAFIVLSLHEEGVTFGGTTFRGTSKPPERSGT
jgi:hypothetical protein